MSPANLKNCIATHPHLYLRDARDAHIVLEAVRLNVLPIIRRRLHLSEREELKSGHVYVWEEAPGVLRWTDGRKWSQSRMKGDYLFYEETDEPTQEERDMKAARRAQRAYDPCTTLPPPTRRKDRPSKQNGLTKQTYSATINHPGSSESRKWHIVAYFSGVDNDCLPVVENYEYLRNLHVPHGIFTNGKQNSRINRQFHFSDEGEAQEDRIHPNSLHLLDYSSGSASPTSSYSLPSPDVRQYHSLPRLTPGPNISDIGHRHLHLPPIISPVSAGSTSVLHSDNHGVVRNVGYKPLTLEDRRVLDSFHIVL